MTTTGVSFVTPVGYGWQWTAGRVGNPVHTSTLATPWPRSSTRKAPRPEEVEGLSHCDRGVTLRLHFPVSDWESAHPATGTRCGMPSTRGAGDDAGTGAGGASAHRGSAGGRDELAPHCGCDVAWGSPPLNPSRAGSADPAIQSRTTTTTPTARDDRRAAALRPTHRTGRLSTRSEPAQGPWSPSGSSSGGD